MSFGPYSTMFSTPPLCGIAFFAGNVWDTERQDIFPEVFGQIDHSALYMAMRILRDNVSVADALDEGLSRLIEPVTEDGE